mmetsp:Transcript_17218/g.23237  ORF Transcript_17218/g.23237 Transcript_17218/m.23237 type:complete len:90 (+) Transcript_17218:978-1247(+)
MAESRGLTETTGNIIEHIPRMVQAVMEHPETFEDLYLCCWQQDFSEMYFTPSWVCSTVLLELSYGGLIIDFYERHNLKAVLEQDKAIDK